MKAIFAGIAVWIVLQTFLLPVCVEHKVAVRPERKACIRRKWAHVRLSQSTSRTFQNEAQRSSNKNVLSKCRTRSRSWSLCLFCAETTESMVVAAQHLAPSACDNQDTFEVYIPQSLTFDVAGRE